MPEQQDDVESGRTIPPREAPFLEHMDVLGCQRTAPVGFRNQQVVGSSPTAGSILTLSPRHFPWPMLSGPVAYANNRAMGYHRQR
jgi:hypothetical protein